MAVIRLGWVRGRSLRDRAWSIGIACQVRPARAAWSAHTA